MKFNALSGGHDCVMLGCKVQSILVVVDVVVVVVVVVV